jgi:putative copper export protein
MTALEAIASAFSYIAQALLLGQLVVAAFLLPDSAPEKLRAKLHLGAMIALIALLLLALIGLLLQGAKLQGGLPSMDTLGRYLGQTQSGRVWLVRELYGALLLAGICVGQKNHRTRTLALFALPLIASRSLMSHAVAVKENTLIAVGADALHLIAAGLWAGGLFGLWQVVKFALTEAQQSFDWTFTLHRFSCLAFASVALLAISGVYQSWIHVATLNGLINTDYGKVLGLKLLLFLMMLTLGALNFFSITRKLVRASSAGQLCEPVFFSGRRRIAAECIIGLVIFCVTGLLTVLPPAIHAIHQTATAASVRSESGTEKKYLPASGATVKILVPQTEQVFTGDQVPLRFTLSTGKRGHHVHAYIDGELTGMFEGKAGTLNGIKPGKHVLELRVVAEDHQSELDAFDRVQFVVK